MSQVDTLVKYGQSFQTKVIASLLANKDFLERIYDIIDAGYFETNAQKWIIENILLYYTEYKTVPTLDVFKVKIQDIDNDVLRQSIVEQLKSVYQKLTDSDIKYVSEQFLEFCKNQTLKNAIIDSVDLLKAGEYESIKHKIDTALKAGAERNFGHDYVTDFETRMLNVARHCIKTGWSDIDTLLDGGLGAGEMGVFVGAAGTGKSWLLVRLGAEAQKQGKNVLHFTLELSENYVGRRYDAYHSEVPFQEVFKNKDKIKPIVDAVPGKLHIKYFPLKTISAQSLKFYIEKYQTVKDVKIDLVLIDYPDIMKSVESNKNNNSYTEAGNVYEEVRGMLGEMQLPGWGLSQGNRSSAEQEIIQAEHIADSYRKVMTADVVISFSRRLNDKQNGTAKFHFIKNRFGADGLTFNARMNTNTGRTELFGDNTPEGIKIASEMGTEEDTTKKFLKAKWESKKKPAAF